MYFSNVANEELQHFHKSIGVDFSMGLTEMLVSDLFKVEPITSTLYRVYPLFYCNEIISSNSEDKILDNRCLIVSKQEHETYFSFKTDNVSNNVVVIDSLFNLKSIDGNLSEDEFNSMVYLLRKNGVLNGTINFEDGSFEGVYGTYQLSNNDDILRNDTGFIVTDRLKSNPLTVKLVNPFFLNAKYTLTCTVRSLVGANVVEEDSEDFKIVDTFSIVLVENQERIIDLSSYVNDSVLEFSMNMDISFDVPEIVNLDFELSISADKSFVPFGTSLNLTATLTGEDNVRGYIVNFYENNSLIGTETTDSNGEAFLEYTPNSLGNHIYSCEVLGLTGSVNVEVGMYDTELRLVSDKSIAFIPTTFVVTGSLRNEIGALNNATVKLYNNNTLIDTVTTENDGSFSYEITANANASYNIQAVFESTGYNNGCDSNIVTVTARKLNTTLTLNVDKSTVYYTQTLTITGVLKDELGNPIPNTYIDLINTPSMLVTDNNGAFSKTITFNEYKSYTYQVSYNGDNSHNSSVSASKTVTYQKAPVNISILNPKSEYTGGDTLLIKASSNYGTYNPNKLTIQNRAGYVADITTKDSDGNFVWTIPNSFATNTYNMHFRVEEQTNYQEKAYETTMYIVNNPVDTITLSKSGNNLIINCKKNNVNVPNLSLEGGIVHLVQYSAEAILTNAYVTDSNGNVNFEGVTIGMGAIYVTFAGITSNTITF